MYIVSLLLTEKLELSIKMTVWLAEDRIIIKKVFFYKNLGTIGKIQNS